VGAVRAFHPSVAAQLGTGTLRFIVSKWKTRLAEKQKAFRETALKHMRSKNKHKIGSESGSKSYYSYFKMKSISLHTIETEDRNVKI